MLPTASACWPPSKWALATTCLQARPRCCHKHRHGWKEALQRSVPSKSTTLDDSALSSDRQGAARLQNHVFWFLSSSCGYRQCLFPSGTPLWWFLGQLYCIQTWFLTLLFMASVSWTFKLLKVPECAIGNGAAKSVGSKKYNRRKGGIEGKRSNMKEM